MADFLALIPPRNERDVMTAVDAGRRTLAIEPTEIRIVRHRAGPVLIEFVGASTALAVHGDDDAAERVTLFDGNAWLDGASSFLSAADAARIPLERARIHGVYHYVHVHQNGQVTASTDPLRAVPLVWLEHDRRVAIASRPSLLRAAFGLGDHDYTPAMWLSSIGYRVGDATHTRKVSFLPLNSSLHVTADGRPAIRRRPDMWGKHDTRPLHERLLAFRRHVQAAFRLAIEEQGDVDLALSGGKDSRLMLAILLDGDLHRDVKFTSWNFGTPEAPSADTHVATRLAERYGLHLEVVDIPSATYTPLGPDAFLRRLATHTGITDGLIGVYAALPARFWPHKKITGLYGEALQHYAKGATEPTADVRIDSFLTIDPFGALMPDARAFLAAEAEAEIRRYQDEATEAGDPPDIFYITQRLPNWAGVQALHSGMFSPLYNLDLLTLPFEVPVQDRKDRWVHHSIISDVSAELADFPFANDAWPARFRQPTQAATNPSSMPTFGSWQTGVNTSPPLRSTVTDLIADERGPWWDWLDRGRLLDLLHSDAELTLHQLEGLYGLVVVAQWRSEPHPVDKVQFPSRCNL